MSETNKLLRSFRHTFNLKENTPDCDYMIMHNSCVLLDRYIKRLGGLESTLFEVTYIFNDMVSDEQIMKQLKRLNLPNEKNHV